MKILLDYDHCPRKFYVFDSFCGLPERKYCTYNTLPTPHILSHKPSLHLTYSPTNPIMCPLYTHSLIALSHCMFSFTPIDNPSHALSRAPILIGREKDRAHSMNNIAGGFEATQEQFESNLKKVNPLSTSTHAFNTCQHMPATHSQCTILTHLNYISYHPTLL